MRGQTYNLQRNEFADFSSPGFRVGHTRVNSHIVVESIRKVDSDGIDGMLTLIAAKDDATITFNRGPSTFHSIHAQADNGQFITREL